MSSIPKAPRATWFRPMYGAYGVHYQVVAAP